MMLKDILESEKRNEKDVYNIHFYLEGIFWKSYEWSAYLSRIFPSPLSERERLKPILKTTKNDKNNYVSVGLQLSSFYKYFPNVIGDDNVIEMGEKHIVIHGETFFSGNDFSNYENILDEWKNKIEDGASEKTIKKSNGNDIILLDSDINLLINEIVSYPIESKNLVDNLQFLSHIKDMAIKIKNIIK